MPRSLCNGPLESRPATPVQVREVSSPRDLEAIWAFRYEVYVAEMGKELACADHSRRWLCEPLDVGARHLRVEHEGRILGAMRLHVGNIPESTSLRIDAGRFGPPAELALVSKTMVVDGERSSRVFAALAQYAYRCFFAAGIKHVVLHCRPSLRCLYERLGFRAYGCDFLDAEVGPQVAMHIEVAGAPAILRRGALASAA